MSKKVLTLIACTAILSVLAGCQQANGPDKDGEVISEKNGPAAFLAGTWKTDENNWFFTFAPDGSISKFKHYGGMEFEVDERGVIEEWRSNITATFILGPCEAHYDTETRQLSVKVVVEHYVMVAGDRTLEEGNFNDYLTGPVSEDGKRWKAIWNGTAEVIGRGSNSIEAKELIFTKASDEKEQ